jgi:predicted transport protein
MRGRALSDCRIADPELRVRRGANQGTIRAFLKVDPGSVTLEEGLSRDVPIGHFGTGALEVTISSDDDLERTKPMIVRSYEAS